MRGRFWVESIMANFPRMNWLEDIWIMRKEGTVLFNHVINECVNEQIFGSFMSAVESFANKIDQSGLSNFQVGQKTFISKYVQDMYFIASYSSKVNPKEAEAELDYLASMFLSIYQVQLNRFHGNVKPFKDFEKKMHKSMDKSWILT